MEQLVNDLLEKIKEEAEKWVEYKNLSSIEDYQEILNLYLALQNYKKRYL